MKKMSLALVLLIATALMLTSCGMMKKNMAAPEGDKAGVTSGAVETQSAPVKEVANAKNFTKGQHVQVLWHGKWWKARVLEIGQNQWKITYDGYDSSWDEWVGPDRIR